MATVVINIACLLLIALATTPSLGQLPANGQSPPTPNPVVVRLPPPPVLEGPLAVNNVLTNARKVGENLLTGPASIIPAPNGWLYSTQETGHIAVLSPQGQLYPILRMSLSTCGQPGAPEDACGRPMGLRADADSWLVVADAYNGVYRVHPQNGREQHYPYADARRVLVNNKPLGFVYDLAVSRNGPVYFTSASSKWKRSQAVEAILEGDPSGRVLVFNPRLSGSSRLQELVTNINFPTGIELSSDNSYLLVAEGARSRIFKAYLGSASPKGNTLELFAQNLPGVVSNIRRSPRGTYWVSFSSIRHAGAPNVMDLYGSQPALRMEKKDQFRQSPRHAMAVELDENGKILRSIHDPTGVTFDSLNEVREVNGTLFLAAMNRRYIGVVRTSDLPPVNSTTDNSTNNTQLAMLLQQLRVRLSIMPKSQVDAVVLALVERLVYVLQDLRRLQNEIQQLKNATGGLSTTSTPANQYTTTTTSPATSTPITTPITTPGGSTTSPLTTVSTTPIPGLTTSSPTSTGGPSSSPATGTDSTPTTTTPVTTTASSSSSASSTSPSPSAATTSGAEPSLTTTAGATPQTTASSSATTTTATNAAAASTTAATTTAATSTAATTAAEGSTTSATIPGEPEGIIKSVTTGITTTAATGSTTASGVTTSGITTTSVLKIV